MGNRLSKEEVIEAAKKIKTRSDLMPTDGPSEPHKIVEGSVEMARRRLKVSTQKEISFYISGGR